MHSHSVSKLCQQVWGEDPPSPVRGEGQSCRSGEKVICSTLKTSGTCNSFLKVIFSNTQVVKYGNDIWNEAKQPFNFTAFGFAAFDFSILFSHSDSGAH